MNYFGKKSNAQRLRDEEYTVPSLDTVRRRVRQSDEELLERILLGKERAGEDFFSIRCE